MKTQFNPTSRNIAVARSAAGALRDRVIENHGNPENPGSGIHHGGGVALSG